MNFSSSLPASPETKGIVVRLGIAWRFLLRHPIILVGSGTLTIMLFIAVFAPWLGTVDPTALAPTQRMKPPSAVHWFGTDQLGRDLYSRVMYGARISLTVGIIVAGLSTVIGVVIGLISGYIRLLDALLMRVMDGFMSVPPLLLAIALVAISRPSTLNVIIAITLVEVPRVARVVRSVVLSVKTLTFVEAATTSGSSTIQIMWRHILPNSLAPIIVHATYIASHAMIIEAILSFLGAGTPPTIPSWGNIIAEGRVFWQIKPFIIFFPALFLSLTILSVNLLGDGLRDVLDPRMARDL